MATAHRRNRSTTGERMIDFTESQIILAVVGVVGLLTTLAVYSRASRANERLEMRLKRMIREHEALINKPKEKIEQAN